MAPSTTRIATGPRGVVPLLGVRVAGAIKFASRGYPQPEGHPRLHRRAGRQDDQEHERQKEIALDHGHPARRERAGRDERGAEGGRGEPAAIARASAQQECQARGPGDEDWQPGRVGELVRQGGAQRARPPRAPENGGLVARPAEGVQGVAGQGEVAEEPNQRGGHRERGQPRRLAARASARGPYPVRGREQPGLGPPQPRHGEQREHRRPRPPPPCLDHQRPEHEREVGEVEVGPPSRGQQRDGGERQRRRDPARGAAEPRAAERERQPHDGGQRAQNEQRGESPAAAPSGARTTPSSVPSGCGVGADSASRFGRYPAPAPAPTRATRPCRS